MADNTEQHLPPRGDQYEYEIERLLLRFFRAIHRRMREEGITQTELAARMGVSQAYISKLLNYNQNLTIRSLAILAAVMGAEWDVPRLTEREELPQHDQASRPMSVNCYPLTHLLGNDADFRHELVHEAEADTAVHQTGEEEATSTSYVAKVPKRRRKIMPRQAN